MVEREEGGRREERREGEGKRGGKIQRRQWGRSEEEYGGEWKRGMEESNKRGEEGTEEREKRGKACTRIWRVSWEPNIALDDTERLCLDPLYS
jgi:hypothetical protein